MRNALATLLLTLLLSASLFGATSVGTLTWDASTLKLKQPSGFFDSNAVGIGVSLFGSNSVTAESLGARPSYSLGGYTNRLTWQGIIVDSRSTVQQAIDDVASRGGGVVELGPGEWRFGDETNAGTIYLKPHVRLRGAGMPTVENAFSGTFSMTNIAGRITATMLHFSGGSTNGYGAPCIAIVGTPYYTNQYSSWFYDANTEVVWYRSGGNEISDLGIWSGWKWPWNGTNPPGAAIFINEVSEVAINRVFIGPTAGPGIYRRGAFGNKISGSYIASTLSSGIVTVDTSDTVISDSTIVASSGSAMTFTGELRTNGTFQNTANTHRMYGLEVWNNNTELVGWRDAGQTTTNWTTVENSDTRRDGYSADASTDLIGNPFRIGADTGMPVFVGGTDLPGGLSTNVPYYVRWGAAGGTNFYLCNTAGRALNGGAVVDITSAGGTNWFLYAPQAIIHAHGSEEIQIDGMRADQSWAGILDLTKAPRVLVNGLHAWELGYNQIARDRRQTWYDPNIVAVRLRDVNTFVMSGSMVSGSKGNSGVGVPWIHNSFGVVAHGLRDGNISGNMFDRVDTGILLDDQSGNVGIDPGQFGSWVSRPVVAPSGLYGVAPNNPYWDAKGSAQIVAPITSGYTNVTGDWSVAIKVRVPDQPTNSFLYHNAVFNLSSVTNADFSSTNYNALVERSVVYSFYRSVTDSSMNFAGLHIGTNYPGVAGVDDKRFNMDVTPFIGKDVEIVVQRSNNWQQLWLNGEKRAEFPLSDWISTGVVYAPFFIVGQLKNSTNLSHLTTPLYGIAYHHRGFSDDEINSGLPWAGTNAVLLYDFRGDSAAGGVLDKSGRGHDGLVQQTGSSTAEFGSTDDAMFTAGSGMTITRTGKRSWTFSSSGGSGVTDGDKGDITVASSGSSWTIDSDAVALGTDTTGNFVATVAGTANEVSVSGSGSENAAVTLSLPSTIDLGGKTSLEVPNAAAPTVDAFGEIAGDNDAWAASRGAIVAYDGTEATRLVGVLSSDTPSNGQVPVWNTGGTITWETQSGSGTAISTNGGNTAGLPVVIHGDASFGTTNSLTVSNLTVDVLTLTSPIDSSSITNSMATDAEVAAGYVPNSRSIYTSNSITGGGDLSANLTLSLVNDSASPGANKYYGTDGTGTLGYQSLPGFGGSTNGVSEAPSNGVAFVRQDESWKTNSFSLISGTAADGQIPSAIARDSEVAAAYQGINTNLTDLADGSLTPARVGFQSGPVNGRASTFGDYIRSIHTNQPVSIPTEPRLLLLAPIGGQSLATGSGGVTNSFSTNPRHPGYSLSWTQGVHYGEPGTAGVVIASSALTATKDLFAEVVAGPGRSETPVVAAVDYWNTYWSNNVAGNRARVLAVTHGLGGAELNAIDEGTASFSNLVAHIQGAANIAVASNWVLNVPVWYFVHGENDTYLDTPELNYRTNFMTMYDRMNSITKAASGQSNDPVVIMTQTASRTYENQSNSWPANAQLFLNLSSEGKVKVAVPTYTFPTVADGVHLTNIVSAWLGEYLSKAARHELFGLGWNPVMPTNVAVSGTNVVIKYHVPKPPLVFDTNLVSNPGSFGYALDGATIGTPKVSGNVVTIPFTAGSPTRVKYGWNGTLGAADGPTTGQRGNLRDSDLEVGSLTGSNLYNWGLIFNLPTTAPSTPSGLLAASGNGKITLSWNRVSDASFYSLKRALGSGGPYTTIKVTNGSSFEDTDVAPLVTYYYVVTAKGPSGESSQSAEVVGTTSGGTSTTRSWVPTDLGSRLAGWYRASSVSVGENNPIDSWTDESGNGYHLTGSSTVRPTQQTVSGRTVVRFDGTDDRLDQASIGTKFSGIGEANFWTVGRPNTTNVTAGNRNLWYMSRATNGSVRLSLAQSSITPGRWRFGGSRVDGDSTDNDDSGTLIDTNSTVILHAKFDFSNADKFLNTNGVVDTSDTSFASAGTTAAESLSLYRMGASALAAGGAATNWYAGDIEMQIITTGVITTDEQQKIEGYIAHALGLTNLLDAAHPYKTNAPVITVGSSGNGDVVGPSSSVDGELAIMSGTTGKLLRSGGVFRVSQSNIVAIGSVTNYVVDLALASIQLLVATNDVNFLHATNAAAGRGSTILIQASGANRTITLPANLKRTKSSVVVTNASILPINFYAHGPDNTNVIATVGSEGF